VHIHLVNLDRSPERLAEFCEINRHLTSVSRFRAIEGSSLSLDVLVDHGMVTKDILGMFTVGALGCAMSNVALWDRCIASGELMTTCEDDAIFNHGFEQRAGEVMKQLPQDWDVIFWGFNLDMFVCFDMLPGVSPCVATFDQERMRAGIGAFQSQAISPQAYRLIWAFGPCCYSISPKGASTIKRKILPLKPQIIPFPEGKNVPPYSPQWRNVGLDNSLNAIHREINSFICFPPLVVSKNETSHSTIGQIR
jgi:glycosyl transferase family 25